jgi:hypothetical protein
VFRYENGETKADMGKLFLVSYTTRIDYPEASLIKTLNPDFFNIFPDLNNTFVNGFAEQLESLKFLSS